MNKITYLLGAGASADALPMVSQIPIHLYLMADYLERYCHVLSPQKYIEDVKELQGVLSNRTTIDSYAKRLSQNDKPENSLKLNKLKSILSGLFMFEQLKKKHTNIDLEHPPNSLALSTGDFLQTFKTIDERYQNFIAKVVENRKLDPRINILSWNYDLQLEIALETNLGFNYPDLHKICTIFPHCTSSVSIQDHSNAIYNNPPQIVKLNGTAGLFLRSSEFYNIYLNQEEYFDDLAPTLIDVHKEVKRYDKYNPYLKFAWEEDDLSKQGIKYANEILKKTEVLIVIGYSFPDFNRIVDRQLFNSVSFESIFLQLPQEHFAGIKDKMKAVTIKANDAIHRNHEIDFFIPPHF